MKRAQLWLDPDALVDVNFQPGGTRDLLLPGGQTGIKRISCKQFREREREREREKQGESE